MMSLYLLQFAQWLIDRASGAPPNHPTNPDQERHTLAMLWATDSVRQWFEGRERYLIVNGFERFIVGKMENARAISGQLVELRALKGRMSGAWAEQQHHKKEEFRKQMLATEKKIS